MSSQAAGRLLAGAALTSGLIAGGCGASKPHQNARQAADGGAGSTTVQESTSKPRMAAPPVPRATTTEQHAGPRGSQQSSSQSGSQQSNTQSSGSPQSSQSSSQSSTQSGDGNVINQSSQQNSQGGSSNQSSIQRSNGNGKNEQVSSFSGRGPSTLTFNVQRSARLSFTNSGGPFVVTSSSPSLSINSRAGQGGRDLPAGNYSARIRQAAAWTVVVRSR